MHKLIIAVALALGVAPMAAAEEWGIALPTSLPGGKARIEAPLWAVFTDVIAPGDRYRVVNGTRPGRIALIDLPEDQKMTRKTRRAQAFRAENGRIYEHLKAMEDGPAPLDLAGLLRREAANRSADRADLALLILGDPTQLMPDAPSFSMRDESGVLRIPSDRHLSVGLQISPWGLGLEGSAGLAGIDVHICPVGQSARLSPAEDAALRRFWALYLAARSGQLASWEGDLETCFERFAARRTGPVVEVAANPHDRDLVMRRVGHQTIETVTGVSASGKTVIDGVEVEDFSLFADRSHPTLPGVDVVTGVRYAPEEYPKRYQLAWCYFSVRRNGTEVKFDLGTKRQGKAVDPLSSTVQARRAAGIDLSDVEAGARACQWPNS
ncbi:MAG: hypothetical protein AAFR17_16990 [Pseudomonadota bacterium]